MNRTFITLGPRFLWYAGRMPFDTHAAVKMLTAAAAELARGTTGADEALAEAVVHVARDAGADRDPELATRTDVAAVKTDVAAVKTDVAAVKTDVAAVKTDVVALRADIVADIAALEVRLLKWMIGTAVGVAGLAVAVLRLLG